MRLHQCRTFEELAILPNGTVNEAYRPLTISMYHLHMHRWLEVFSREQLLVVNGDQLIEDPVSQLRRIETFLGMYGVCALLTFHHCFFSCFIFGFSYHANKQRLRHLQIDPANFFLLCYTIWL